MRVKSRKRQQKKPTKITSASSNPTATKFRTQATKLLAPRIAASHGVDHGASNGRKSKRTNRAGKHNGRIAIRNAISVAGKVQKPTLSRDSLALHDATADAQDVSMQVDKSSRTRKLSTSGTATASSHPGIAEDVVDPFAGVRQKWNSQLESDREVYSIR